MDWIRITPADLEGALNKPQLDILKAQALRTPSRDIAQDAIDAVVARVRAEIAASGLNALDEDHSRIPYELKECALRLAVELLQVRVSSIEITQNQIRHADLARELLLRVATGELPISRPECPVRGGSAKRGLHSGAARRSATRASMEGI